MQSYGMDIGPTSVSTVPVPTGLGFSEVVAFGVAVPPLGYKFSNIWTIGVHFWSRPAEASIDLVAVRRLSCFCLMTSSLSHA